MTSGTAERLAAIVEAAEQAAAKVIDDAEKQARRQLLDAGARADRIVAERLRALADELDPPVAPRRELQLKPVELAAAEPDGALPRSGSAGARLLATQMAVSGSSREEIESGCAAASRSRTPAKCSTRYSDRRSRPCTRTRPG